MLDLKLGDTQLKSRVILAPMSGLTDLPFRKIVREFGDFLMFSEMIASQAMIRHVKRTYKIMESAEDYFTSVQIVGADPEVMAEAARLCTDLGVRFLDINMGCPIRKIVKTESGSALMKNERLATKILESVVSAVSIPVTLKMRLGWDTEHRNSPTIAKIAENSGIQMIAVHGRTRSQLYSGKANWEEIRKVKEMVKIPIIVNGDIVDIISAKKALSESGADGIMIGRGALGSPWLLADIHNFIENISNEYEINLQNKFEISKRHIEYIFDFYEQTTAVNLSKKALGHYFKGTRNASKYRQKINTIAGKAQVCEALNLMLSSL
ncbi:MAG: tRNA dihydrouridine synthase DusB [Holosporales bacterium]|jgi:tRNA-dihydrouridine synthase B|nr:tRNA dihydrouridine synthase DusB [Holosporales bacterium]